MNHKVDMLKSYIRGALSLEAPKDDLYMQGFEAGIRAIRDYIGAMERPFEELGKKNKDSQFSC